MSKIFYLFILALPLGQALACPGCAGSMDNPRDLTYIYVLAGFIALIYIPFFIIFRVIKKNKDANVMPDSTESPIQDSLGHEQQ